MEAYIFNRYDHEAMQVTAEEAQNIIKDAAFHTGPHGGLGPDVALVLYEERDDEHIIRAFRWQEDWFELPEQQSAFFQTELSLNSYEG